MVYYGQAIIESLNKQLNRGLCNTSVVPYSYLTIKWEYGGDIMLDELKEILSSLYCQLGLTDDVLRLSQVIDELINQEMK